MLQFFLFQRFVILLPAPRMSGEQFQFSKTHHAMRMAFPHREGFWGSIMDSSHPRIGDLLVVRLSPDAAGILVVTGGDDHRLHSPYNTVEEALDHARQMAATSLVDVWHRRSPTTFDLIASYRPVR